MPNNLIVDVGRINDSIKKINDIYAEAGKSRIYVNGNKLYSLHINPDGHPLKVEAFTIGPKSISHGWGRDTIYGTWKFKNNFISSFSRTI